MNGHIILLHGIHMHAWIMLPFARLLAKHGFDTETFGYYSIWQNPEQHCIALAKRVEAFYNAKPDTPLHFVGHSLGGLVLRHFAAAFPSLVKGRIVTLGTPHQGSATAAKVRSLSGIGVPLLGWSYRRLLDGNLPALPAGIGLGSLAGNAPMGLGRLFGLQGENDGTVTVAETQCPNQSDHIVLPLTHTGMLVSPAAASQSAAFIQRGKFVHNGGMPTSGNG